MAERAESDAKARNLGPRSGAAQGWRNVGFWTLVAGVTLALIVAVNTVLGMLVGWGSLDLTTESEYTLSPATHEILHALEEANLHVEMVSYLAPERSMSLYRPSLQARVERMLSVYGSASPAVDVRSCRQDESCFQDAEREIAGFVANSVVVRVGERNEVVRLRSMTANEEKDEVQFGRGNRQVLRVRYEFTGEQQLSAALERLRRDVRRTVYVTTDHGEALWSDEEGGDGYGRLSARLDSLWMDVRPLVLRQAGRVPDDCDVLVIAGPRHGTTGGGSFAPSEIDLLDAYLDRGGGLLLLVDRGTDPRLGSLLTRHGVVISPSALVVDPASAVDPEARPATFRAWRYGAHPITAGFGSVGAEGAIGEGESGAAFSAVTPTWWSAASPVLPRVPPPAGVAVQALVATSASGWGETEPRGSARPTYEASRDLRGGAVDGGVSVAVAAERRDAGGRLVVFGSRRFVANEPAPGLGEDGGAAWERNAALVQAAISWLAGDEQVVSGVTGRGARARLYLDSERTEHLFRIAFLYVPMVVILAGVTVWLRRSRRRTAFGVLVAIDVIVALYLWFRVLAPPGFG